MISQRFLLFILQGGVRYGFRLFFFNLGGWRFQSLFRDVYPALVILVNRNSKKLKFKLASKIVK